MDQQAAETLDLNWDYLRWNAIRSPKWKLLYVATPKVACTSLKWWFARLEGFSGILHSNVQDSKETAPDLIIHDSFHKVAPEIAGLPPEPLAEAIRSEDYFRFALVRNPFKRIFSAWQSKLLLREPLQAAPYLEKAFYHQSISSMADVAGAFEAFLEHLEREEAPSFWDVHWTPQFNLLRPDVISYTSLSQIENVSELEQLLAGRLGDLVPSPFALRSSNESLLPYRPEFISDRSAELIRTLYAADFERFGYGGDLPTAKEAFSPDQFDLALKAIEMIRGRHERFGVMRVRFDQQMHDLQLDADSRTDALKQVIADAANRYAEVQLQFLEQVRSLTDQAAESERRLAEANATIDLLNQDRARVESSQSQLSNELSLSEASRARLADDRTALEASFAQLEQERAELNDELGRANDELSRAAECLRELREGIATHLPASDLQVADAAQPSGMWHELEVLQQQIVPLEAQRKALESATAQQKSLRFLAWRFCGEVRDRILGRRS